jgi:hypothetical protein
MERKLMTSKDQILISWCTEDVKSHCDWLTWEQARDVLQTTYKNHDCNEGISWDTFYYTALILYPQGEPNE